MPSTPHNNNVGEKRKKGQIRSTGTLMSVARVSKLIKKHASLKKGRVGIAAKLWLAGAMESLTRIILRKSNNTKDLTATESRHPYRIYPHHIYKTLQQDDDMRAVLGSDMDRVFVNAGIDETGREERHERLSLLHRVKHVKHGLVKVRDKMYKEAKMLAEKSKKKQESSSKKKEKEKEKETTVVASTKKKTTTTTAPTVIVNPHKKSKSKSKSKKR